MRQFHLLGKASLLASAGKIVTGLVVDQIKSQESVLNWYAYFGNVDYATGNSGGCFCEECSSNLLDGDMSYDSYFSLDAECGRSTDNSLIVQLPQAVPIKTIYLWIFTWASVEDL